MSTRHTSRTSKPPRTEFHDLKPFHGGVMDLAIADKSQVQLFNAIGCTKAPFHGVIDWPYLNSVIQDRSRSLLDNDGQQAWHDAGGVYGDDGKPTFSVKSSYATEIVQGIASDPGGFIWTDTQEMGWAVSLVSVNPSDPMSYGGLAISWNGAGRMIDPLAREEYKRAVEQQIAELNLDHEAKLRKKLQEIAERMWLYERGEQLLWAIHAAVLMQRRSIILLPDVSLGEIVWGGQQSLWPANWRNSLMDILWSLSQLHVAEIHVGGMTWRPQFTMRSVAVAACEALERNRKRKGFCQSACPLWHRPEPHEHFLIQIGYGFLGLLEKFAVRDDKGTRQFDFVQQKPSGDEGSAIVAARKQGQIVPVHLPTKVFGPSAWSQLSRGHRAIIQGLVREVTRVKKKSETKRRDRADVLIGNRVPDIRGRRIVACPLLQHDGRYVAFNGNGLHRGLGYLIVGRKDHGWLAKCGYIGTIGRNTTWTGRDGIGRITRDFLRDLEEIIDLLGLTVVGLVRTTGAWLNLGQLKEIAELSNGLKTLSQVHLRVYGPEDYLDRCRRQLAERGNFATIPGADGSLNSDDTELPLADIGTDLKMRMQRAGLSQDDLAAHLGKSKSYISQLLNGKKAWPEKTRELVEQLIAETSREPGKQELSEVEPKTTS